MRILEKDSKSRGPAGTARTALSPDWTRAGQAERGWEDVSAGTAKTWESMGPRWQINTENGSFSMQTRNGWGREDGQRALQGIRGPENKSILAIVNNLGESQASWTRPKESRKATYFFPQFDIWWFPFWFCSLFGFFFSFLFYCSFGHCVWYISLPLSLLCPPRFFLKLIS